MRIHFQETVFFLNNLLNVFFSIISLLDKLLLKVHKAFVAMDCNESYVKMI